MIRWGALALVIALCPQASLANTCATLEHLTDAAETGFVEGAPENTLTGAASCDLSRISGGGATYLCHWQFAYRDPAATEVFHTLDKDIRGCLSGLTAQPAGEDVNHPDTYLQRAYMRGPVTVSVALKDKAALAQTLVFLRLDTR